MNVPNSQSLPIALRAFAVKNDGVKNTTTDKTKNKKAKQNPKPSEWALIFDTETTTDASQQLRFGTYQVRKSGKLIEEGVFYSSDGLSHDEITTLENYADKHDLQFRTVEDFMTQIFYGVGYDYRATIIGFNLPFDIARLAIDHATAKASPHNKIMKDGFSFKLSENLYHPRVQIKHISSKQAFIQFTSPKGQRTSRWNRKKGHYQRTRRGFFIDIKTLAAALMSQSFSLDRLAQALNISSQKHHTDDHGAILAENYIEYARRDTQTTWECYEQLYEMYKLHGLQLTQAHNIHSEASLGKAYLKDMGIKPWQKSQPNFSDAMIGLIMSTYYGGRSEVHIRKKSTQVLYCDFLSMYPTVCTLMKLWDFVTAKGVDWKDTTQETRALLNNINVGDLKNQNTWQSLATLVQVSPKADIFPVRAKYDGDAQYTIGLNYLTSDQPIYYTLADCITSKLLTGHTPQIIKAISFTPQDKQEDLKPVCIAGNENFIVDPNNGDFFKNVINLRRDVKHQMKNAPLLERTSLYNQQLALKILANATSYGIFVELNVEEDKQSQELLCHGYSDHPTSIKMNKHEAAGMFFHPLLATLITGAARLMLGITEHLIKKSELDWAFCDTDSMAIGKPDNMDDKLFHERSIDVQEWFSDLNPYGDQSSLLQIEDDNYSLSDDKNIEPLYCYAISSKRYALYNIDPDGNIILRKVSAHGLGHLIAPYQKDNKDCLKDTQPWQQDFWLEVIQAAHENRQPEISNLTNFDQAAVIRYGATTPRQLRWFNQYNQNKPYNKQVKPFNFLLCFQGDFENSNIKPVAPFDKNTIKTINHCFDRETNNKINRDQLKTNTDCLIQYHLHPESKFLNANYMNCGMTQRRHICVSSIHQIGKEANKLEEQYFMGFNPDAQIDYGIDKQQQKNIIKTIQKHPIKDIARYSKLSERTILNINKNKKPINNKMLLKLQKSFVTLENQEIEYQRQLEIIFKFKKENKITNKELAEIANIDESLLSKILNKKRKNKEKIQIIYSHINKKSGN